MASYTILYTVDGRVKTIPTTNSSLDSWRQSSPFPANPQRRPLTEDEDSVQVVLACKPPKYDSIWYDQQKMFKTFFKNSSPGTSIWVTYKSIREHSCFVANNFLFLWKLIRKMRDICNREKFFLLKYEMERNALVVLQFFPGGSW